VATSRKPPKPDDAPATPRIGTGTYRAFRDDALQVARSLAEHRVQLDARKTALAASLVQQLEIMADEFSVYEPDAGARAERVSRFYGLLEQVSDYLAGDR
jgi:hypothetical protein